MGQQEKKQQQNYKLYMERNLLHTVQGLRDAFCEEKICHAVYGNKENFWNSASIDSRTVSDNNLFFGLVGNYDNGGKYVQEVMYNKTSVAVIDIASFKQFLQKQVDNGTVVTKDMLQFIKNYEEYFESENNDAIHSTVFQDFVQSFLFPNFTLIVTKDSLQALISLTTHTVNKYRDTVTIIAISGSMGKTTTKNLLAHILQNFHPTVCSIRNLNTVQGLAISVLNVSWDDTRYAVFEYGISEVGEMDVLVDMIIPDIAVLTNVGSAHLGNYKSKEELQIEKLKIAKNHTYTKILFLPEEDTQLHMIAQQQGIPFTLFGKNSMPSELHIQDTQLQGIDIKYGQVGVEKHLLERNIHVQLNTFIGKSNISNIYASLQIAKYLGFSFRESILALKGVQGEKQRFEIKSYIPLVIDDSYNANYEAMKYTLQWFVELSYTYKIAILGGMKELGYFSDNLHAQLMNFVSTLSLTYVILVGQEYQLFHVPHMYYYSNVNDAKDFVISLIQSLPKDKTAIVLKGSNSYKLNELIESSVMLSN